MTVTLTEDALVALAHIAGRRASKPNPLAASVHTRHVAAGLTRAERGGIFALVCAICVVLQGGEVLMDRRATLRPWRRFVRPDAFAVQRPFGIALIRTNAFDAACAFVEAVGYAPAFVALRHAVQRTSATTPFKVCGCGATYSAEEWSGLAYRGVQEDDEESLELRDCAACGSSLAVPVRRALAVA